jgi:hypothetical protein
LRCRTFPAPPHRTGRSVFRIQLSSHYGVKKNVENLPRLRDRMSEIIDHYHDVQQDMLETFIDRGQLRRLAEPTILANGRRIPGLKLDHPRQLAVMHSLVRFANVAAGGKFTTADVLPSGIGGFGINGGQVFPRLLPLRLVQTPCQKAHRKGSPYAPLPAGWQGLHHLRRLSETGRENLWPLTVGWPHLETVHWPQKSAANSTVSTNASQTV